ncbi:MAG: phage tail protein [Myxococcaceae bacterium]
MGNRPFALVRTFDQWVRCAHQSTAVDPVEGVVQLSSTPFEQPPGAAPGGPGAGLVFDAGCRLYHSVPPEHRVDRLLDPVTLRGQPRQLLGQTQQLLFLEPKVSAGLSPAFTAPKTPRGLAIDSGQRLWVADAGTQRLLAYDLDSAQLLRSVPLAAPDAAGPSPVDLAVAPADDARGQTVYGVTQSPAGWFRLTLESELERRTFDPLGPVRAPGRLAVSPTGVVVLLDSPGTAQATLYRLRLDTLDQPDAVEVDGAHPLPWATDVKFLDTVKQADSAEPLEVFAVAGPASKLPVVMRFTVSAAGFEQLPGALAAYGYDGLGIVRAPLSTGGWTVGYWSARGFKLATTRARAYAREGQVAVIRLDAGTYRNRWGRLFIDACVPADTSVAVRAWATDDDELDEPSFAWSPPDGFDPDDLRAKEASPPLPPLSIAERSPTGLYRRDNGAELPWVRLVDPFETYDAPVFTGPGRYLYLLVSLSGNGKTTPRIRAIRAEKSAHVLLKRLPKVFSRQDRSADFLQRMLAPLEGLLDDLDARSQLRELLVLPDATPEELLPWLASFVGLVLDQRWSEATRRQFLKETVSLFRLRGTLGALTRMLELALGGLRPVLIEKFRLRGLATLSEGATATSVLGAGMRVGGAVGSVEATVAGSTADAFATHAHRFSVFIPASGQQAVDLATFVLEAHRPAHTVYDVCTLDRGMRIGLSLHLGINSFVGPSAGFARAQLGEAALGVSQLGRPPQGFTVGSAVGALSSTGGGR